MAWYTVLLDLLKQGAASGKAVVDLAGSPISSAAKAAGAPTNVVKGLATFEGLAGGGKTVGGGGGPPDTKNKPKPQGEVVLAPAVESGLPQLGTIPPGGAVAPWEVPRGGTPSGGRSILPPPGSALAQDDIDIRNLLDGTAAQFNARFNQGGAGRGGGTDREFAARFPQGAAAAENLLDGTNETFAGRFPTDKARSLVPEQGGGGAVSPEVAAALAAFDQPAGGQAAPAPRLNPPTFDNSRMGVANSLGGRQILAARTPLYEAGLDRSFLESTLENPFVRGLKQLGQQIPFFGALVPNTQGASFKDLTMDDILDGGPIEAAWNKLTPQERTFALFDGTGKAAQVLGSDVLWERAMGSSELKTQDGITSLLETGGIGGQQGLRSPSLGQRLGDAAGQALSGAGGAGASTSVSGAGGGVAPARRIENEAPSIAAGTRVTPDGGTPGALGGRGARRPLGPGESRSTPYLDRRPRGDYTWTQDYGPHKAGDPASKSDLGAEGLIQAGVLMPAGKDPDAVVNIRRINQETGVAEGQVYRTSRRKYRLPQYYNEFAEVGTDIKEGIGPNGERRYFSGEFIQTGGVVGVEHAREAKFYYDLRVGGKARALTTEEAQAAPEGALREVPRTEYRITKEAVELGSNYLGSLAQFKDIMKGLEGLDAGAFSLQGKGAVQVARFLTSVGLGEQADDLVKAWTGKEGLVDMAGLMILLESWVNTNKMAILNDQRISGPDQIRLDRVIEKNRLFGSVETVKEMVKSFQMYGLINNELKLFAAGRDRQFPVDNKENIAESMALMKKVGGLTNHEAGVWARRLKEYPQLNTVYSGGQQRLDANLQPGAP